MQTTWFRMLASGMGKHGRKRNKSFQVGKNPKSPRVESEPAVASVGYRGYKEIVKENAMFEKYYKSQGIIPESEWDRFMATMRVNLPLTFRITGTRQVAESVLACLEQRFLHELRGLEVEGEKILIHPLEWYPGRLAWHLSVSRPVVRKSPLLSQFHSFLVRENEQGNISRQEGVSMIPPLLLGVEPGHHVLDMCAAPGSKTAQLIEALHATDNPVPGGVIIANDADNKRCYMLVHQAKRLNSPCFMVTNHDASTFPILYHHDKDDVRHPLYYDRVLCDVPCSGDGTMRKNPTIWRSWNPGQASSVHKTQLRILVRGLELLSPGGRIVYSTCSLNPIEDEAVIHTALKISEGSLSLVDCSNELKGLARTNGLSDWKVMSKNGEWASPNQTDPKASDYTVPSMFPPSPEEAAKFHLHRCLRVLPHLQDTGGFFVAVLEKTDWLPWQLEASSKKQSQVDAPADAITTVEEEITKEEDKKEESVSKDVGQCKRPDDILGKPGFCKKSRQGFKEDPFVYLEKNNPIIETFSSFYGFPESFPANQLMTRTYSGKKKCLYFTSHLVKELTIRNERRCKIINTGVRVLSRSEHRDAVCQFRLTQEGIETMKHYVSKNIVPIQFDDLIKLLSEANPLTSTLSTTAQEVISPMSLCPALLIYNPEKSDTSSSTDIPLRCPILLSGWIGPKSVRLFVPVARRCHFLAMLGREPPKNISLATIGRKKRDDDLDYNYDDDDSDVEIKNLKQKDSSLEQDDNIVRDEKQLQEEGVTEEDVTDEGVVHNGESVLSETAMEYNIEPVLCTAADRIEDEENTMK